MAHPISISSIDHITIIVADIEQTRAFYCDRLGLQVLPRPDFDFPGLWIGTAGQQSSGVKTALIHATLESDLAGQAGWGDRGVGSISRGHHFAFQVEDAFQACQFLEEQGVSIAVQPKRRPDGPIQFYILDPDGHVVELFSVPTPACDSTL